MNECARSRRTHARARQPRERFLLSRVAATSPASPRSNARSHVFSRGVETNARVTVSRASPGPRSLGRAPRGDGDTDTGAATTSSRRSASINLGTHALENANGARTIDDDKKTKVQIGQMEKTKCARPTEARRDNVCEFVRSSDARGRRPSGRSAGRARRPRWTWAIAMRVVRLDRGREG